MLSCGGAEQEYEKNPPAAEMPGDFVPSVHGGPGRPRGRVADINREFLGKNRDERREETQKDADLF